MDPKVRGHTHPDSGVEVLDAGSLVAGRMSLRGSSGPLLLHRSQALQGDQCSRQLLAPSECCVQSLRFLLQEPASHRMPHVTQRRRRDEGERERT